MSQYGKVGVGAGAAVIVAVLLGLLASASFPSGVPAVTFDDYDHPHRRDNVNGDHHLHGHDHSGVVSSVSSTTYQSTASTTTGTTTSMTTR